MLLAEWAPNPVRYSHIGLLGPKPAYAMDHPFNFVLLVADSLAAVLAILCLASGPAAPKAKTK